MRKLSDLYTILLEEFEMCKRDTGICSRIDAMVFSDKCTTSEWSEIMNHIRKNKPNIFSRFYWHPSFNWAYHGGFWWKRNNEGYKQRVKFLESLIEKCLKEENEIYKKGKNC